MRPAADPPCSSGCGGHACNTRDARRSIVFDIWTRLFRSAERFCPVARIRSSDRESLHGMHGYRGYLELVRPANVATALADVLAGYAVAGLGNPGLGWLLVATACLYAGGVVLNDVFDRDIDRTERPERPIPSGRVSVAAAAALGLGLLALGVFAASLATSASGLVAAATAGCVLLYDAWGKRQGLFGPVNMGLCRGLNLLLGVSAAPAVLPDAWPLALAAAHLHRRGDRGQPGGSARRASGNRGFRSDILESGAGGARGARASAEAAGPGPAWRSRLCSGGVCCRHSGAPTARRRRGRFDTRSGRASCRSCCSTRRSARRTVARFTASRFSRPGW